MVRRSATCSNIRARRREPRADPARQPVPRSDRARKVSTICGKECLLTARRCARNLAATNTGLAFAVDEGLLGLGNRIENARRDTFRIVGGIEGDLGSSWNYEVSVNYGQLKERTELLGNLDTQRMLLAMDAVRDPATGKIVCRSQIDPTAAFGGTTYFY